MIRRGLQLIAVVGLLGAAPFCFGQAGTTNAPSYVVLQDFDDNSLNGLYNVVGTIPGQGQGSSVLHRYTGEDSPVRYVSLQQGGGYSVTVRIHSTYPETYFSGLLYQGSTGSQLFLESWTGQFTGYSGNANESATAIFGWGSPVPDPYEEAFPDWESAAQKIPLGFTFAMAFWGVAVAGSMAMRWVKDLASAAS